MIKLEKPKPDLAHPADLAILRGILKNAGFDADYYDIQWAWKKYSRHQQCRWIAVPLNDDSLCLSVLRQHLKEKR